MRVFVAAMVVAVLAFAGCSNNANVANRYELSGFVRDPSTGHGIGGVTVTFTSDTLDKKSTTTSGNGAYAMVIQSEVPFGQVHAEKASFLPADQSVYFDSPDRRVDLDLRPQ